MYASCSKFHTLPSSAKMLKIVAGYSHQTFPWTICRSVRACVRPSVCPVHCGKTADRIRMPFGIIGRAGPGMRQVMGFGDRSTQMGNFGANLGRPIVTNRDFTAYVCDSASTIEDAVWGGTCGGHCCIRWRSTSCKGKGRFWRGFVPHFQNGKCHWVTVGEMFPIRIQELDSIFVRQTYRANIVLDLWAFWQYIHFLDQRWGL